MRGSPSSTTAVAASPTSVPAWPTRRVKEAVRLSHAAFHEEDMFADLPKIACPTLLVYAGQGGVITDADAIEVVSLLKGASKIKIDHVAHVLPFEDLDAFVAVVQPFIMKA